MDEQEEKRKKKGDLEGPFPLLPSIESSEEFRQGKVCFSANVENFLRSENSHVCSIVLQRAAFFHGCLLLLGS